MSSAEYFSKDILEESFLKTASPYHFIQQILGSCRVDARHRFVTAPTVGQKLYTIFSVIVLFVIYFRMFLRMYEEYYEHYSNIFYLLASMSVLQLVLFTSNLLHVRFLNSKDNMQLFIKMQQIERLMKIDKEPTVTSVQYRIHVVTVFFLVAIAFANVGLSFIGGMTMALSMSSFIYCEFPFSLEISHCSNIILYFAMRIRIINHIISNHLHRDIIMINHPSSKFLTHISIHYLTKAASKTHDFRSSDTDIYLREIFRGFDAYRKLYRFQIALFWAKICLYILIGFEYVVLAIQNNVFDRVYLSIFASIISVDLLAALLLCLRCEVFFRWIKETKLLTISVMSIYVDGPLREKAKRMYNIIEEMPPNFSIYDMWHMNARLVLSVFNLITSFIVTLLQFAFL